MFRLIAILCVGSTDFHPKDASQAAFGHKKIDDPSATPIRSKHSKGKLSKLSKLGKLGNRQAKQAEQAEQSEHAGQARQAKQARQAE